jgi:hypothetical protein
MQIAQLAAELEQDAVRAVPPFGAKSIQSARQLGSNATGMLLDHIRGQGDTAFLALEALREADPPAFGSLSTSLRARIYVDALAGSTFFNAWGLPGYQLTPTAHALAALDDAAVAALKPLLVDDRPAPLAGSEDATTSQMYRNRVRDYAWALINEAGRRPYHYSQDPAQRDRDIASLLKEL